MSELILHHYWPSPFAHKIRLALRLAGAPWVSVEIPRVPPKPLLMPLTGGYRRTPVLQVGADIFCDTQNIARCLGELGCNEALFPGDATDTILSYSAWLDACVFDLAVRVVITEALDNAPADFIRDRAGLYFGPDWTPEGLRHDLPSVVRQLAAHCAQINRSYQGGRGLFSASWSYADVGVAYLAWFIRGRWSEGDAFLAQFPAITRVEAALHAGSDRCTDLDGEAALQMARDRAPRIGAAWRPSVHESLTQGQPVCIKPRGQSTDPWVSGRLLGLTDARVSIHRADPQVGEVVVHFPVAGYQLWPQESD